MPRKQQHRKLVAVYGTLKRGESNYGVTQACDSEFIGTARTIHHYCMYGGWGFPRVTKDHSICPIQVEVFSVEDFEAMDSLEGHPTFFRREQIPVALDMPNGEEVVNLAWMYFHPMMNSSNMDAVVQDGLWRNRS